MAERTADVQAHWTRPGVLARIDAALTELGHEPQNLNPEILVDCRVTIFICTRDDLALVRNTILACGDEPICFG